MSIDQASVAEQPELSVVIPCLDEANNLRILLPRIEAVLREMRVRWEILVVDGGSRDETVQVARSLGAETITSAMPGYGGALRAGFQASRAPWVATLDADFSHHPAVLRGLYSMRDEADIIIASRYVQGGFSRTNFMRKALSRILNRIFRHALSLPVRDLSSGFRLYRREAIPLDSLRYSSYAVLQEILTKSYCDGYRVCEIPFHYHPRRNGRSHIRLIRFARDYLAVLCRMWMVRNSINSADYDTRAFHSRIPLQRYWQRKRYQIILDGIGDRLSVLDVGCGSSQILNGAPQAVGLDIRRAKLRFMRRPNHRLVQGSVFSLPFPDRSFEVVICSQVIEHVPADPRLLEELIRVLEPGGSLILGTPDYGMLWWPIIEKLYAAFQPGGYADEHITHYTRSGLTAELEKMGLHVVDHAYICRGELILHARKPI